MWLNKAHTHTHTHTHLSTSFWLKKKSVVFCIFGGIKASAYVCYEIAPGVAKTNIQHIKCFVKKKESSLVYEQKQRDGVKKTHNETSQRQKKNGSKQKIKHKQNKTKQNKIKNEK